MKTKKVISGGLVLALTVFSALSATNSVYAVPMPAKAAALSAFLNNNSSTNPNVKIKFVKYLSKGEVALIIEAGTPWNVPLESITNAEIANLDLNQGKAGPYTKINKNQIIKLLAGTFEIKLIFNSGERGVYILKLTGVYLDAGDPETTAPAYIFVYLDK